VRWPTERDTCGPAILTNGPPNVTAYRWAVRRRMASTFLARRLNLCGKDLNLYDNVVRHEVAPTEYGRRKAAVRRVSTACSQSPRASSVTMGCEAGGNAEGEGDPSARTGLGKDGAGERE